MATRNIVPRATGEGSIGTSAKTWGTVYADDIAVTNNVTASSFTGDLTGTASENLPLSGGTMTGKISFSETGEIGYRATTHDAEPRPLRQLVVSSTDIDHWGNGGGGKIALHTYDDTQTNTLEDGGFEILASNGLSSGEKKLIGKPDGSLAWGGVQITDGTLLTKRIVSTPTITSSTSNGITVTPPTVSGYQFVCWVNTSSEGGVYGTYIGQVSNRVWWLGSTPTGTHIDCTALYVRKW